MMDVLDRFENLYMPEPNSGCWLWLGSLSRKGYGSFRVKGKWNSAHRFSYELHKGLMPAGHQTDHLCRVRCCVNPDHLEAVTPHENSRRSPVHPSNRTHCPRGHAYVPENTYAYIIGGYNYRYCKTCLLERSRAKRKS